MLENQTLKFTRTFQASAEAISAFNASIGQPPPPADLPVQARSMFAVNLLIRMLEEDLPGHHVFESQSIKFNAPVIQGDTLDASVTTHQDLRIYFEICNQREEVVLNGEARLRVMPG